MSQKSKIEWTDATWNPVRGCTKVSPGCKNCYAETFAERFRGVPDHPYEHGFDIRLVPGKVSEPLRWKNSRMIFVNSMSDLFHPDVPDEFIVAVAKTMQHANWHIYQVLTKRADRLVDMLQSNLAEFAPLKHIWWGVSVEDKKYGIPRLKALRQSPAAMEFLSVEPLLEDLGVVSFRGIDWVIVGGESGHGCRPIEQSWVRKIRAQCRKNRVPFFFKQWGGVRKKEAGRTLDGKTYDELPAFKPAKYELRDANRLALLKQFDTEANKRWLSTPLLKVS